MNDLHNIRILSAGAPKTGVRQCAEAYSAKSGTPFEVEFATAPVLRERVGSGNADADVIVAPLAAMENFVEAGHVVKSTPHKIGSVTAGVVVRNGAPDPDLASAETLIQALLDADSVVYNEASSGQYIAKMIENLGIANDLASKTVRVPSGAAVMQNLAASTAERAIGFGQITEIRLHENLGVHLVGPLPESVGKVTDYAVGLLTAAAQPAEAQELIGFMVSPDGKKIFVATGVN